RDSQFPLRSAHESFRLHSSSAQAMPLRIFRVLNNSHMEDCFSALVCEHADSKRDNQFHETVELECCFQLNSFRFWNIGVRDPQACSPTELLPTNDPFPVMKNIFGIYRAAY